MMRNSLRTTFVLCAGTSLAIYAAGCSKDTANGGDGKDSIGDAIMTDSVGDGDGDGDGDGADADGGMKFDLPDDDFPAVSSIRIEPEDVFIEVVNGSIPADTDFDVYGMTANGEIKIDDYGAFSYSRPDLGTIKIQDGLWAATGESGGQGVVRFEYMDGQVVETNASVKLVYTFDPSAADVTPGIKDALAMATLDDPTMDMLYPYDQTVFPLGLVSPVIQWNGGAAGDVYKISAESTYFSYTSYLKVDPPSRYAFPDDQVLPQDIWVELTEATQGPATISVQRYDTANQLAYKPNERTWNISQANLTGILYYWEVNNGNVVKLGVGDPAPASFLDLANTGVTCVACHSVSADGSTIVGGTNGGPSPWATWEADGTQRFFSASQFGNDWANQDASGFQAISPDGKFLVTGQSKGQISLKLNTDTDATSLATLQAPNNQPPVHPAWSPDGKKIAFATRTDGNWLDFTNSSLWVVDVDTTTPGFANYLEISPADPTLPTSTFPTFSPDSKWVAYNRANMARTRDAVTELWLVNDIGTQNLELNQANGDGYIPASYTQMNYEPTFMPVSVGGYFWLVFGSERAYGNTLGENTKQLWVTAIDANLDGSKDPSHPAFWLPGQELNNQNMRGNWALEPCRANGDSCESGFDCCTGYCVDDGMGGKTCSEDAPECSAEGDACQSAADCCSSTAQCIGGFCAEIVPG